MSAELTEIILFFFPKCLYLPQILRQSQARWHQQEHSKVPQGSSQRKTELNITDPQYLQTPLVVNQHYLALKPTARKAFHLLRPLPVGPLEFRLQVFQHPSKPRPMQQIHSLKNTASFFHFFLFIRKEKHNQGKSEVGVSCRDPQKPQGAVDLTWQGEGFTRPYAWLNRDARSLGLGRGTSIKGSCHLTTCFTNKSQWQLPKS